MQAEITWDLKLGDTDIALTTGIRVHEDEEDRLQKEDGLRMQELAAGANQRRRARFDH